MKKPWLAWGLQAALAAALTALLAWLVHNTQANLAARGLSAGYGFLRDSAGFDIAEALISYEPSQSYARAFAVGILNTIRAAAPAVVLATAFGFLLGIAAIAEHPLVRLAVRLFVDTVRNIPLLVQVLLWYFILAELLPEASSPLSLGPIYLSRMGLAIPNPFTGESPSVGTFGVSGGMVLTPELLALVGALTVYATAYCSEIVRAGLTAVPRGQWNAAMALGMKRGLVIRKIVVPQGLRVMVPPYISLALSTIKNSSLAVAIGYPDVVMVANTTLNQTGRAIECVSIIAAVYLAINLVTSALLNAYNRRAQIKER